MEPIARPQGESVESHLWVQRLVYALAEPSFNIKTIFLTTLIPMIIIRQAWYCVIFLTGIPILVRQQIYTESAQWFFAALHEISSYTGQQCDNNIAIFVFNYFCLNDPSHCFSYVFHNFQTSRNTWKIFQIYTTHQWWYKKKFKQIGCVLTHAFTKSLESPSKVCSWWII